MKFDPPIFFHPMTMLSRKQRKHQPTLLMTQDAWDYVSDPGVTHLGAGAFGADYDILSKPKMKERYIDSDFKSTVDPLSTQWVVVWKFPGDLNHLPGSPFRKIFDVPLPVGAYPLFNDNWAGTELIENPSLPKNSIVEKMRTDVPSGNSVHYLENKDGVKVGMISSTYFIREFWGETKTERQRVIDMI